MKRWQKIILYSLLIIGILYAVALVLINRFMNESARKFEAEQSVQRK